MVYVRSAGTQRQIFHTADGASNNVQKSLKRLYDTLHFCCQKRGELCRDATRLYYNVEGRGSQGESGLRIRAVKSLPDLSQALSCVKFRKTLGSEARVGRVDLA